jgi:hypothetical protein
MGFLRQIRNAFGAPEWLKLIPSNVRPTPEQVTRLEALQVEYSIAPELLAGRIIDSTVTTRRIQAQMVEEVKRRNPALADKEVYSQVLATRALPPYPGGWGWDLERVGRESERLESFEDLVDLIINVDNEMDPRPPDPTGLGSRIDAILSS